MLWTITVILVLLWFIGLVTSFTMGGFIHVLLVIAIVVVLINPFKVERSCSDDGVLLCAGPWQRGR